MKLTTSLKRLKVTPEKDRVQWTKDNHSDNEEEEENEEV